MKQEFIHPKLLLAAIRAVKKGVENISLTSSPALRALIEAHPKTLANIRMILERGEDISQKALAIQEALEALLEPKKNHS